MKIKINFTEKIPEQLQSQLYHYLRDNESKNIQKIEWIESESKKGDMGQGPVAGIGSIVAGSQIALVELFKTLQVWIKMYDKELSLTAPNGTQITLRGKLSEKNFMKLTENFAEKQKVPLKKATTRKKQITKAKSTKRKAIPVKKTTTSTKNTKLKAAPAKKISATILKKNTTTEKRK